MYNKITEHSYAQNLNTDICIVKLCIYIHVLFFTIVKEKEHCFLTSQRER